MAAGTAMERSSQVANWRSRWPGWTRQRKADEGWLVFAKGTSGKTVEREKENRIVVNQNVALEL